MILEPLDEAKSISFCLALRTRRLARLVTRHYEDALRETGLTLAQLILIGTIALKQPLSPTSLGRILDLDKSTLSRTLRPLVESKLLASEAASGGGQSLRITGKGQEKIRKAFPAWKEAQTEVLTMLGSDALSNLDGMIAAVAKHR